MNSASTRLVDYFSDCIKAIGTVFPYSQSGRLTRSAGLVIEATGLKLPVGSRCLIQQTKDQHVEAEVVGFHEDKLYLMPLSEIQGLVTGAMIYPEPPEALIHDYRSQLQQRFKQEQSTQGQVKHFPVGDALLGRVLDGAGRPLDNKGPLKTSETRPITSAPLNPIDRHPIDRPLDVGVRPINAMLTVGRGQRMGLFAGSGVGKSVLLGMMAKFTEADITIVGLIGERGREVKEFIDQILGEEGLARSVVVAAPADVSPLLRLQGAAYATVLAEYFRDQGKNVLLIMDSLTRYAMAQREIALAVGEPPATKGYPPSVFAKLPALVERAGNGTQGQGSITAFYTVLTEGDDQQDPIADSARAILDGHIVLNRQLAESGHYPAIDIEQSISRAMHSITSQDHQKQARSLKGLFSRFQRARDLIQVGAYVAGSDPELDLSIQAYPAISQFFQQDIHEQATYEQSHEQLVHLYGQIFSAQRQNG